MGFFKNLVSKFPCELCQKEVGALNRTKLQDGKYICFDCTKNCSTYYPTARYNLEEVKKHMQYMQNYDKFCREVFDKNENKKDFSMMFQKVNIIFADDLGMFEIVTNDTKKKNYRELFRYDQIYDFKLYGIENTGENVTKKYKETGIKIKMLSKLDYQFIDPKYDQVKHDYALEFTIPCATSTDVLDGGFILKHLDKIFNTILDGKIMTSIEETKGRCEYRRLPEVERLFNRGYWKEVADNKERDFFGKTIKEL